MEYNPDQNTLNVILQNLDKYHLINALFKAGYGYLYLLQLYNDHIELHQFIQYKPNEKNLNVILQNPDKYDLIHNLFKTDHRALESLELYHTNTVLHRFMQYQLSSNQLNTILQYPNDLDLIYNLLLAYTTFYRMIPVLPLYLANKKLHQFIKHHPLIDDLSIYKDNLDKSDLIHKLYEWKCRYGNGSVLELYHQHQILHQFMRYCPSKNDLNIYLQNPDKTDLIHKLYDAGYKVDVGYLLNFYSKHTRLQEFIKYTPLLSQLEIFVYFTNKSIKDLFDKDNNSYNVASELKNFVYNKK